MEKSRHTSLILHQLYSIVQKSYKRIAYSDFSTLNVFWFYHFSIAHDISYKEMIKSEYINAMTVLSAVLWISGRPVAKCDPLRSRAIQHDNLSHSMGDPILDKWEHDLTENMQILC